MKDIKHRMLYVNITILNEKKKKTKHFKKIFIVDISKIQQKVHDFLILFANIRYPKTSSKFNSSLKCILCATIRAVRGSCPSIKQQCACASNLLPRILL